MARTNREIAYILRLRNQSQRDVRQFVNTIRRASRDVNRSLSTISKNDPFSRLNKSSVTTARNVTRTSRDMSRAYRSMSMQVRRNADAMIRDQNRIILALQRMRREYARPLPVRQARAYAMQVANRSGTGRRATNSGAGNAARVAAVTSLASARYEANEAITNAAMGAGLVYGAHVIANYADEWTNLGNRLSAMGTPFQLVADKQKIIMDIAERSRSSLEGVGQAYTRMLLSSREVGASQDQVARATETVSKAMAVSGATTAEANASIIQLGQALGSGILAGDELRSIRENAPLLAQAIAKEFNTTIGGLKQLGSEGKLTSDRVFKAILEASKEIDEMFAKTRGTVSQGFVAINNALKEFIGLGDQASGVSLNLAGALQSTAKWMRENHDILAGIATTIALLAGARFAVLIAGWASAFLGLTGPVGLAIAAIAAAVGYVVSMWNETITVGDESATMGSIVQSVWIEIKEKISDAKEVLDNFNKSMTDFNFNEFLGGQLGIDLTPEPPKILGKTFAEAYAPIIEDIKNLFTGGNGESLEDIQTRVMDRAKLLDMNKSDAARMMKMERDRLRAMEGGLDTPLKKVDTDKEAERAAKAQQREIDRANKSLLSHIAALRKEEQTLGLVGDERERVTKLIAYETQLQGMQNLTDAQRQQLLTEYNKALVDHIQKVNQYQNSMNGAKEAAQEYALSAGNAFENAKTFMSNTLSSLEDALTTFMTTGKLDWKKFVSALIADFMRLLVIRPLLANLAKTFGFDGGSSTGTQTSFLDGIKSGVKLLTGGLHPVANSSAPTPSPAPERTFAAPVGEVIRKTLPDVTASVSQAVSTQVAKATETIGKNFLSFGGNFNKGVDSRLMAILNDAASKTNLGVRAISGFRAGDPRYHGKGMAADVQLFDPSSGKVFDNYQSGSDFRVYEQFAQQARLSQMNMFPELNDRFRWGGYFSGPKGKYGALDTMHFDLAGDRVGMGGGSWAHGLTAAQRRYFPNARSIGMGAGGMGIDTSAITNSVNQVNTSLNAVGSNLQQVSNSARLATNGFNAAGMNVQQAGSMAQTAGPQFQQAGSQIRQAGAMAANAAPAVTNLGTGARTVATNAPQAASGLGGLGSSLMGFIQQLFSGLGGLGGGGGGGIGGIFSGILGLIFHKGGIVGQGSAMSRTVSAIQWGGAERYHSGGLVGSLKSGERNIVAKDNEAVLPTVRLPNGQFGVQAVGGGGGGTFISSPSININVEGGSRGPEADKQMADELSKRLKSELNKQMAEFAQNQMRSGGLFNQGKTH